MLRPHLTPSCSLLLSLKNDVSSSSNTFLLTSFSFPVSESAVKSVQLNSVQELGIDLAIRYGESLKLLSQTNARAQLQYVHRAMHVMLTEQQKPATDSEIGKKYFWRSGKDVSDLEEPLSQS